VPDEFAQSNDMLQQKALLGDGRRIGHWRPRLRDVRGGYSACR
jgi:hypothetical protein